MELRKVLNQAGVLHTLSKEQEQYSRARAEAAAFDSGRGRAYLNLLLQVAGELLSSAHSARVCIRPERLTLKRPDLPTVSLHGSFSIFDGRLELGLPEPLRWIYEEFERIKAVPEAAAYLNRFNVRTAPIASSSSTKLLRSDLVFYLRLEVTCEARTYYAYAGFDAVLLTRMHHYRQTMAADTAENRPRIPTRVPAEVKVILPLYSLASIAAIRPGGKIPLMKNPDSRWLLQASPRSGTLRRLHCRMENSSAHEPLCLSVERVTNHQSEEEEA